VFWQGFPHSLHSAELILQLISRASRGCADADDAVDSVRSIDADDSSVSRTEAASDHAIISADSLTTLAEDVRSWALLNAYSSSWIQRFQSST